MSMRTQFSGISCLNSVPSVPMASSCCFAYLFSVAIFSFAILAGMSALALLLISLTMSCTLERNPFRDAFRAPKRSLLQYFKTTFRAGTQKIMQWHRYARKARNVYSSCRAINQGTALSMLGTRQRHAKDLSIFLISS